MKRQALSPRAVVLALSAVLLFAGCSDDSTSVTQSSPPLGSFVSSPAAPPSVSPEPGGISDGGISDGAALVDPSVAPPPLEPEPGGVSGGAMPGEPGVDPSIDPAPGETPDGTMPGEPALFDAKLLEPSIGKSLADFTADAEAKGASVRVVIENGVALAVTEDFGYSRVNVAVKDNTVTEIVSVG